MKNIINLMLMPKQRRSYFRQFYAERHSSEVNFQSNCALKHYEIIRHNGMHICAYIHLSVRQ